MLAVRILVDQSGYDLLNIGDVAMLQSCVSRLCRQWPDAEIMIIAHEPRRLADYCPGATAIGRTFADLPLFSLLPLKPRLLLDQAWKMVAPYFTARFGSRIGAPGQPRTAIQAVQAADLVVVSGGGFVADMWWWHAMGVLSLLSLAQRLGKPTAMFGQGLGPMAGRVLRAQTAAVLPGLQVLGLREDQRDLALSLGARSVAVTVTGDDSLELISDGDSADGLALGVNVRVSRYSGVDKIAAAAVGDLVLQAAEALGAPLLGLPVSRYPADADLGALRLLLDRRDVQPDFAVQDLVSPEALVAGAARCHAIVTGSYHVAVVGLGLGVPVVCVSKSPYYDSKFSGLRALFPGACSVVSLAAPDYAVRLRSMIQEAWHLPESVRSGARVTASRLRVAGREAYAQFRIAAENPVSITSGLMGRLG